MGAEPVETIRPVWKKSSYSCAGNCVEVADLGLRGIAVRDSKNESGPALIFTRPEWDAFQRGVRDGEFDF
ncbi:DUF397 domain-containing protein [Herbidospora sp. NBRC 101105]|uniref:DUF397 domain-containing protein n=1 Tax=Herbidospora sp. NBRC 101105 TaxID=3032195 RepID=UPI002553EAE0|nr:DUF397 domain-containing protein [Herbidospora sp. NBRC 101105]